MDATELARARAGRMSGVGPRKARYEIRRSSRPGGSATGGSALSFIVECITPKTLKAASAAGRERKE